jgi:hypothetical protein
MFNVTLLSGEGAIGKSKLMLQLSGGTVLGREWIGTLPAQGSVLYVSCEEDDDELRRQTEDVAVNLGSTRQEMAKRGLRPLSFAGKDAILAQPDRSGIMRLCRWLREANGVRLGRLSLQRRGVSSTGSQLWSLRVAAESISSGWDEEP